MADVGRPTKFKEEYIEQAYKLCLLGMTDKQLANYFEVSEQTVNAWKHEHPEFLESLKKGKLEADAEIASSLYNRAKGMPIVSQQAIKLKDDLYENGKRAGTTERVEVVELIQEVPPDPTSMIFWLKNRQPELWRDKREAVEVDDDTGEITINVRRVGKDAN